MYKGNGNQRVFPLPADVDGSVVYLVAGGKKVRMVNGEGYVTGNGNVLFSFAPPLGAEIIFGDEEVAAVEVPPTSKTMLVLHANGTMEEVSEDPAVLLAEARELLREAKAMLKAAVSAQEAVRIIADEQRRIGEATFAGRLAKYEGLAEESVKSAAMLARDDIQSLIKSNMLEMRNKHKATVEAHAAVRDLLSGAKRELGEMVDEAVERMEAKFEPMLEALNEMRDLAFEARKAREAAKNASFAAGAEVMAVFGSQSNVVLEELRSVKSALNGEVKSVIEGAKAAMAAEIEQVRALRDTAGRAAKRCEEIERKAGSR